MIDASSVRRYYERNTRLFVRFGSSASAASIHRALWAPGVRTSAEALNRAHVLVLEALRAVAQPSGCASADLGCGVGGALRFLLDHAPAPLLAAGLTLSPTQSRLARARAPAALIVEADFQHVPLPSGAFDLAYSIEAFAHAPDPDCYFAEAARLLRPGGRLLLIDDTLARAPVTDYELRMWAAYVRGWHVCSVMPPGQTAAIAARHGLRLHETEELTQQLRLRAIPQPLAIALARLTARMLAHDALLASSVGSVALQQLLARGVIAYRRMVFAHDG
jgi:SAM-dependent methyltransferase